MISAATTANPGYPRPSCGVPSRQRPLPCRLRPDLCLPAQHTTCGRCTRRPREKNNPSAPLHCAIAISRVSALAAQAPQSSSGLLPVPVRWIRPSRPERIAAWQGLLAGVATAGPISPKERTIWCHPTAGGQRVLYSGWVIACRYLIQYILSLSSCLCLLQDRASLQP